MSLPAIFELVDYVNDNEYLRIPKNYIDESLEQYTFGYDLSGSLLFNLAENGLININTADPIYFVEIDRALSEGIPEPIKYIAEFIKTLRKYNSREGAFSVSCLVKDLTAKRSPAISEKGQNEREVYAFSTSSSPYEKVIFNIKKEEARKKKEEEQNEQYYQVAMDLLDNVDIDSFEKAVNILKSIKGYKDSETVLTEAESNLQLLKNEERKIQAEHYNRGCELLEKDDITLAQAEAAASAFRRAKGYKDAASKVFACTALIRKLNLYDSATVTETSTDITEYEEAIKKLKNIEDFKDTKQRINQYEQKIQQIKDEIAQAEKKKKTRIIILLIAAAALIGGLIYFFTVIHPKQEYNRALEALQNEQYGTAKEILTNIPDYEDAQNLLEECELGISYNNAKGLLDSGNFDEAKEAFGSLGSYKDSAEMVLKCDAERYLDLAGRMLSEEIYNEDLIETMTSLKALGLSDYEQKYNEVLAQITKGAFEKNHLDVAETALNSITDPSLIDSSFKAELEKALAEKKAAEEKAAREKAIADAYQELCDITVKDSDSIKRAEELLDVLPSDYRDVADFVKVFNYYKPYLGQYTEGKYSGKESLRITSRKNSKWIVYIGDVSESGAEFVYPSYTARRDFNSSIYDVWTIQSTNTITHMAVRNANTFYSTYTR